MLYSMLGSHMFPTQVRAFGGIWNRKEHSNFIAEFLEWVWLAGCFLMFGTVNVITLVLQWSRDRELIGLSAYKCT